MSKENAEQEYREALENHQQSAQVLEEKKQALDQFLIEEEVQNQAVFFEITEDEARERIEQNRNERENGLDRTIWPEPHTGRGA